MSSDKIRYRIDNDDDFINIKRFDYSLKKLLERYPNGVPDRIIAQALSMEQEEVEKIYNKVLEKLRNKIGVKDI